MTAYTFNTENMEFCGTNSCQIDPVRSEREGKLIYLIPGNSTLVKPPEFDTDTQTCKWDGERWNLEDRPSPEPVEPEEPTYILSDKEMADAIKGAVII